MGKRKKSSWGIFGLLFQGVLLLLGFVFFALFSWGIFDSAKSSFGNLPSWAFAVIGLLGWIIVGLLRGGDPKTLFFKKME